MIDINDIDYAKLALTIIKEFDEDKEENGHSEMERSLELLLDKYNNEHDLEVISDVLIAVTGYSLKSLITFSKEIEILD